MEPAADFHPSADQLLAFSAGHITDLELARISTHLAGCPTCCAELDRLGSQDTLLNQLRHAAAEQPLVEATERNSAVLALRERQAVRSAADAIDEQAVFALLGPPTRPGTLGRLGTYEVLEIVGRGGMGIVFRAEDTKLHRIVAIKILAPQLAASGAARQRFIREAQATAAVRDEHVVAVHAVEDEAPVPYLVMEYIGGRTLEDLLRASGPLGLFTILRIGMQTASGLAAAHRQGLVHRDVKPANILLENGVQRVKLTDFGLARAADDASLTRSGVVAGTPMYMSPEQAQAVGVDHRTDLFSLGSVLYTLCTGRPPFRAEAPLAVLMRVCHETPRPIRELNPQIPAWFADVVDRLMQKDPARRIQTAAEVADLLAGYLAHLQHPTQTPAPRLAPLPRLTAHRWRRGALAALLLAGLVAGAAYYFTRPRSPDFRPGQGAWLAPALPTAEELAKRTSPLDDRKQEQIAAAVLRALGVEPDTVPTELIGLLGEVRPFEVVQRGMQPSACVPRVWTRDGKRFVTSGPDRFRVWSAAGELLGEVSRRGDETHLAAISPDGSRLVTPGDKPFTLFVWDTRSFTLLHTLEGHTARIADAAFSPDGKALASGGADGTVRFWEVASGKLLDTLDAHSADTGGVSRVLFADRAKRLATHGRKDGKVRLWDMDRDSPGYSQKLREWDAASENETLLFAADDRQVIFEAASSPRRFRIVDAESGKSIKELAPAELGERGDAALVDGGKALAVFNVHKADVCVIDLTSGRVVRQIPIEGLGEKARVAADPAGTVLLAGGSGTRAIRRFAVATGKELTPGLPARHNGPIRKVAVSPDGRTVASGGVDFTVRLWDLASGQQVRVLTGHAGPVVELAFSPDGKYLASGCHNKDVVLWDVATGEHLAKLRADNLHPALAFSPDGATLAVGTWDAVSRYRVPRGESRESIGEIGGAVRALAFSPDGQWLAVARNDRHIRVIDLATGQPRHQFSSAVPITAIAFSPDSRGLFVAGEKPTPLRHWDLSTSATTGWTNATNVTGLSMHPGNGLVATGFQDGTVRLMDLALGSERWLSMDLSELGGPVEGVSFTPEGRYLVAGLHNGMIALLKPAPPPTLKLAPSPKLPTAQELANRPSAADALKPDRIPPERLRQAGGDNAPKGLVAILGEGSGLFHVTFSPDATLLACASAERDIRLWDLATGTLRRRLEGHALGVRHLSFNRDGTLLASASEDRTAKVWEVSTGQVRLTLAGHRDFVERAVFTPDGTSLVTCSRDRTIRVWDLRTGRQRRSLGGTGLPAAGEWSSGYWCLSLSPDGTLAATGEADGSVRLWDLATGWQLVTLRKHTHIVRGVAFHPSGQQLASCGYDQSVRLWNLTDLTSSIVTTYQEQVLDVDWTGDGRLLASTGGVDGVVRITNTTADATAQFRIQPAPTRYLHGAAFSPEGRYLATANPTGTTYVLRLAERGAVYRPEK